MSFNSWSNVNKLPPSVHLTYKQFNGMMRFIMGDICKRIFNSTEVEKEKDKISLEEIGKCIFEWEVLTNYESN